jgi:hypothetical protein
MGIIAPNQKKLLIPRKGTKLPSAPVSQSDHDANMRAIEIWANAQPAGGVSQLIAGTNITLDPADGLGAVTINSSGGGGGGTPSTVTITTSTDFNDYPSTFFPFGPTDPSHLGVSNWSVWSNAGGSAVHYTFGIGWMTLVNGGDSINFLPIFEVPAFTGGSGEIGFQFYYWACDSSFVNFASYEGNLNLTTGQSLQTTTADLTPIDPVGGGDLSLVSGSGTSGNGLVSTGGGILYWCGVSGIIAVPAGTTFS